MLVKTLLLAALGVVSTTAQLTNSTLLSILNTTQLSPSSKFIQLLQSSPDYQPILQLLSQPGNWTLFVPSDAVFDRLIQEFNETQQSQGGSGGGSGGGGASSNETTTGGSNGSGSGESIGGGSGTSTASATQPGGTNGGGSGTNTGTATQPAAAGNTNGGMSINSAADGANGTTTGGGNNGTMSGGGSGGGGNSSGSGSGNGSQQSSSQQQNTFPQGFTIFGNFSVADIISYHIVEGKIFLQNDTNQTTIVNSMLSNQTADKFGYGMPLIINSNATSSSSSSQGSSGGSGGNGGTTTTSSASSVQGGTTGSASAPQQGGQTATSQATGGGGGSASETSSVAPQAGSTPGAGSSSPQGGMTPELGSWIARLKQLMMAPASTSGGGNNSQTPVYWIGNGLSNANVTMHDIEASNGVLHVIDNVLIPPGNASNVFANATDASALSEMIEENPQVSQALNNATNVTIFAPNDKGLCMVCIDQLGQDKWRGLVMNHVVPGIYYTTNLTESSGGSAPTTLTTQAGESLPVSSNSSGITLNNTIKIVTPNILFNGGVIHLIDKVIAPPSNTTTSNNGTAAGSSTETSSSAPAAAQTSATQPTSSVAGTVQAQATEQSTPSEEQPSSEEASPAGVAEPDNSNPHPNLDNPLPPTSL